jgi:putative peptide zinc metalloprotease protein
MTTMRTNLEESIINASPIMDFQTDFVLQPVAGEDRYMLQTNGKTYYVGAFIYRILDGMRNGESYGEISLSIAQHTDWEKCDADTIKDVVDNQISPLFKNSKTASPKSVKSLFSFLNPESFSGLLKPFTYLFQPRVFWPLFWISVVINLSLFILLKAQVIPHLKVPYSSGGAWLTYVGCIIFFLTIHELGHAIASMAQGAKPGKIGFGIYFIFPAFYTDLTNLWGISREKRIIVNLGGIYLQLLLNLVIIGWGVMIKNQDVLALLQKCMYFNMVISLYNVNPFFRFDGYWIYTDYFDLPNLRQQSNGLAKRLYQYVLSRFGLGGQKLPIPKAPLALWFYMGLYQIFMLFVWYLLIRFIVYAHQTLFQLIRGWNTLQLDTVAGWSTLIAPLVMVSIAWTIICLRIVKFIKQRKHHGNS